MISKVTGIGFIASGTTSGAVSCPSGTPTAVGSITLTPGKWIITAYIDWQSNANGVRQLSWASGVNPARQYTVTTSAAANKEVYQQHVRIVSTTGETFTFYGYQDSGSTINAYPYVQAIKISE